MSYEGYEQHICKNGHYYAVYPDESGVCPSCAASSAWYNCVDQTNGGQYGIIPRSEIRKLLLTPEMAVEGCPHCGAGAKYIYATYRIPTEQEHKIMRHDEQWNGEKWVATRINHD